MNRYGYVLMKQFTKKKKKKKKKPQKKNKKKKPRPETVIYKPQVSNTPVLGGNFFTKDCKT